MFILWTSTSSQRLNQAIGREVSAWGPPPHKVQTDSQSQLPPAGPGDVVLAMGSKALKALADVGAVPKNRTISSVRGKEIYHEGVIYFVTFDAGIMDLDYGMWVNLKLDAALACRLAVTGSSDPVLGDYSYVPDFTEVVEGLEAMVDDGKFPAIAVDLETLTLDPYNPETFIVSISVSPAPEVSYVVRFQGHYDQPQKGSLLHKQINWLLNSPKIRLRGANYKYDAVWIREKWGLLSTAFKMDTTLVGSLLDENRSNSLNTHAKVYTSLGGYDDSFNTRYNKARMDLVPDDDLLTYAGGDTDATLRVSEAQLKELSRDRKLRNFYQTVLHPASVAFEAMERRGIHVNVDHYMKLQEELETELEFLNDRAMGLVPRRLRLKYKDNLSLTRSKILTDFLFTPRGLNLKPKLYTNKAPKDSPGPEFASTAMKHLNLFSDHPEAGPFIQSLQDYGKAKKTLSTYVIGFMKHLKADGKLHPTAILHKGSFGDDGGDSGTVTGRLAFKDPAFQTLPKHTPWAPRLREGYEAPPGYVVVSWDYSQGELRITACVANEPNMIQSYRDGIDLHLRTGAQLNGIELQEALGMKSSNDAVQKARIKKIRQGGKAGNFGLIYGMSAAGYQAYAFYTYGVELSLEEAEQQRDAFFHLYARIPDWHKEYKAFAHQHSYIRSPLGRVRHLPMIHSRDSQLRSTAERQSINSPVQATLSDMSCWSLAEFHQHYGEPEGCQFFDMTHDSLDAYVKEDEYDKWVPLVTEIMENLPFEKLGWQPQLPFLVDHEFGPNKGEMQEVE